MCHDRDYKGEILPNGTESQSEDDEKKGSDDPKYFFSVHRFTVRSKEFCNLVVQSKVFEDLIETDVFLNAISLRLMKPSSGFDQSEVQNI